MRLFVIRRVLKTEGDIGDIQHGEVRWPRFPPQGICLKVSLMITELCFLYAEQFRTQSYRSRPPEQVRSH
jgi:hypothetical protein